MEDAQAPPPAQRMSIKEAMEHLRALRHGAPQEESKSRRQEYLNTPQPVHRGFGNVDYNGWEYKELISDSLGCPDVPSQILFYRCLDALKHDPASLVVALDTQAEWIHNNFLMQPPSSWFVTRHTGLLRLIDFGRGGPFWRGWLYLEYAAEPAFEQTMEVLLKEDERFAGEHNPYSWELPFKAAETASFFKRLFARGMKLCDKHGLPYSRIEARFERGFTVAYSQQELPLRRHHRRDYIRGVLGITVKDGVLRPAYRRARPRKEDSPGGLLYARVRLDDGRSLSFMGRDRGTSLVTGPPLEPFFGHATRRREEDRQEMAPWIEALRPFIERIDLSGLPVPPSDPSVLASAIVTVLGTIDEGDEGPHVPRGRIHYHDLVGLYDAVYESFMDFDLSALPEEVAGVFYGRGRRASRAAFLATEDAWENIPMPEDAEVSLGNFYGDNVAQAAY